MTRFAAIAVMTLAIACGDAFVVDDAGELTARDAAPPAPDASALANADAGDAPTSRDGGVPTPPNETGAGSDGATSSGRCDLTRPFGAPKLVDNVNSSAAESAPWLSSNELTMYYSTRRQGEGGMGPFRVFVATRATSQAVFSVGAPLPVVDNGADNIVGSLSNDGLTLLVASNGAGSLGLHDIVVAKRTSEVAPFAALTPAVGLNSTGEDLGPSLSADGKSLFFYSNRDVASYKMFRATVGPAGTFSSVTAVTELNGAWDTGNTVASADGLTVFFESSYPSGSSKDIWMARRTSLDGAFDPVPTNVGELNSASNESPGWLSADGCRIYLSSDRKGGVGGADIYFAERPQ